MLTDDTVIQISHNGGERAITGGEEGDTAQ